MSKNSKKGRRSIRHSHRRFEQRREAEETRRWISFKVLPMLQHAGYWSHNPELLGQMTLADFLQEISYDSDLSPEALAVWEELNHTWFTT